MDWNNCYRVGETPWDKGEAAPPLRAWLEAGGGLSGRVLVPGCGAGHDVALIAREGGADEVVGLDVAPLALERARTLNGGEARARFEQGDFFALENGMRGAFDWVFEHTCFSAIDIDRREAYVAAVAGALKPGGRYWAIYYLDPYDDEHPRGGGPPHGVETEELDRLFGERFELLDEWVPDASYRGREGLELVRVMELR